MHALSYPKRVNSEITDELPVDREIALRGARREGQAVNGGTRRNVACRNSRRDPELAVVVRVRADCTVCRLVDR